MAHIESNEFGFDWDKVKVIRTADIDGHKIMQIQTPREVMELRITPTGLIRTQSLEKIVRAAKKLVKAIKGGKDV